MTRKSPRSVVAATQKADAIASTLAMARSHHTQGRLKLAEDCYRQVLALDSNNAEALHLLGVVALQSDAPDEAIRFIKRAVRRQPNDPAILVNLGAALRKASRKQEARDAYLEALKLRPDLIEAHFNLGKVLHDLGDMEGSIAANRKCLELNPNYAEAYVGLGNAYKSKFDGDAAIAAYKQALDVAPDLAEAYGNIAAVQIDRLNFTEALTLIDKALTLDPHSAPLRYKRSLFAMRMGLLDTGWKDYESRFLAEKERAPKYATPPPYWAGEDLSDKSLLVWTEQGLGDEIIYANMLNDVIAKAGKVVIECSWRMVPIFARSFPQATVLRYVKPKPGERPPPTVKVDRQVSCPSLGQYFRTEFSSFPHHQGYMKADPARTKMLRARYKGMAPDNIVVGLSWRSKNDQVGPAKSVDLPSWAGILRAKNVTFVNLQYGDCIAELREVKERLGIDIVNDEDVNPMENMDDCFAQVAAMDLVVSTSNTTVHVAGSLNVPTFMMVNCGSSVLWYWFLDGSGSPWYPSLKIFRRPVAEGPATMEWWHTPTVQVAHALERFLESHGNR